MWVAEITHDPVVMRDLAMIKVRAPGESRTELLRLCEAFCARPIDISAQALLVELVSTPDRIQSFVDVLRPFGILEMVQTGAVAMRRDPPALRAAAG
jgi:acetolactate synthase-1/3 small subunit